jgi:hypothetical protein
LLRATFLGAFLPLGLSTLAGTWAQEEKPLKVRALFDGQLWRLQEALQNLSAKTGPLKLILMPKDLGCGVQG